MLSINHTCTEVSRLLTVYFSLLGSFIAAGDMCPGTCRGSWTPHQHPKICSGRFDRPIDSGYAERLYSKNALHQSHDSWGWWLPPIWSKGHRCHAHDAWCALQLDTCAWNDKTVSLLFNSRWCKSSSEGSTKLHYADGIMTHSITAACAAARYFQSSSKHGWHQMTRSIQLNSIESRRFLPDISCMQQACTTYI